MTVMTLPMCMATMCQKANERMRCISLLPCLSCVQQRRVAYTSLLLRPLLVDMATMEGNSLFRNMAFCSSENGVGHHCIFPVPEQPGHYGSTAGLWHLMGTVAERHDLYTDILSQSVVCSLAKVLCAKSKTTGTFE